MNHSYSYMENRIHPETEATSSYVIPTLGLSDGWFVFAYVSNFLSFITPQDLPVVVCILELLRDAFHSKVSVLQIILEALKFETNYILIIVIILITSIFSLGYMLIWCFSKKNIYCRNNLTMNGIVQATTRIVAQQTLDPVLSDDTISLQEQLHCRKKMIVFTLQTIVVLLITGILSMFIINEQISSSITQTPNVIRASLKDTETFIKNAHRQIQVSVFDRFMFANEKVKMDLEDIDKLLGEPIQREISGATSLDLIFESILDILATSKNLSNRIKMLDDALLKALMLSNDAASKIDEIQTQLNVLQRQCNYRDRPLCDTLRIKSFDEIGFIERLRKLYDNETLQKLKNMGDESRESNLKNLTDELHITKSIFRNYSLQLYADSVKPNEEVLKQMTVMREGLKVNILKLSNVIRSLLDKIDHVWGSLLPTLDSFKEANNISWLIGLTAASSTFVVTLILLAGLSCTCCHAESFTGVTLIVGAGAVALLSIPLGIFGIFEMLLGGHGEIFICRAFYEAPDYTVIAKLFDKPGIIYSEEPKNGILAELLQPPEHNAKPFVNATLSQVLGHCEQNKSAYSTFQIDNLLDLENSLNYKNYLDLEKSIENLIAPEAPFISFTTKLQTVLEDMLHDSELNLTSNRIEISQSSPEKEIITFIDQMQRVSVQIQDSTTSNRMSTLASRARRIQATMLQPLDIMKSEIVYHLTALELQIEPWTIKMNNSLNSLHQAQIYLDSEAEIICREFSRKYQNRIKMNLELYRNETFFELNYNTTTCSPLFDIFNGIRLLFCGHIIQPINGLFFTSYFCLFLWAVATPISLLLADTYKKIENTQKQLHHSSTIRYGAPVDEFIVSEHTNWSRPHPQHQHPDDIVPDIDRSNW